MNKLFYVSLFFILLIALTYISNNFKKQNSKPKTFTDYYCKYANEIKKNAIRDIEKTYKVKCSGTGGGMPYFINDFIAYFDVKNEGSIELARKLLVQISEKYLEHINSHRQARPYLVSYPFPLANVIISLSFTETDEESPPNSVNYVLKANEKIYYQNFNPKRTHMEEVFEEPYEEAYYKVIGHPRPETLNPGPRKRVPELNRDGSIAIPAVLNNDPNNPWPEKPS